MIFEVPFQPQPFHGSLSPCPSFPRRWKQRSFVIFLHPTPHSVTGEHTHTKKRLKGDENHCKLSVCFDFHSLVLLDHLLASSGMGSEVCTAFGIRAGKAAFLGEKKNGFCRSGGKSGVKTSPALPAFPGAPEKFPPRCFQGCFVVFPPLWGDSATGCEMLHVILPKEEGSVPCRNISELMFVPSPGSGQNVKACSELEIF